MDFFLRIAEDRIKQALERGDFENLSGKGKPLPQDDLLIPEDLKIAYKILKNSGFLPPEIQDLKEIQNTEELIKNIKDEGEKYKQIKKLNLMVTKLNLRRTRPINFEKEQVYYEKIVDKIGTKK
jgi:hypothetical protein